jgi:hypothetical protein
MRTKQIIAGLNNNQKIRIMVDGFGMYMQVKNLDSICTSTHRWAVDSALVRLVSAIKKDSLTTGFGSRINVYNSKMESVSVDVQVDLVKE